MKRILIQLVLTACLFMAGCSDDDGKKFEGIVLRSPDNQDLGTVGKRDLNDWQNDGTLPDDVLALLDATQDLTATSEASIDISGGYPNPAKHSFSFHAFVAGGPCLFEYVVVNEKMKVLFSGSNVGNNQSLTFDISDTKKFKNNAVIRMYYSFSTAEA